MFIKRAIWISVVAYVATFIIGLLVGGLFGFEQSADLSSIPASVWYTGAVVAIFVVGSACWWFFRTENAIPSLKHGLYFGLISVGVGFVLDFVSVAPFGNPITLLGSYYTQPFFILTIALILVATTTVGYWLGSKQKSKSPVQQGE